jgi:hypothetical protein
MMGVIKTMIINSTLLAAPDPVALPEVGFMAGMRRRPKEASTMAILEASRLAGV